MTRAEEIAILYKAYKKEAVLYKKIEALCAHYTWENYFKMHTAFKMNINRLEPCALVACLDKMKEFKEKTEKYDNPTLVIKQIEQKAKLDDFMGDILFRASFLSEKERAKFKQIHA
jgi:hypothetical protein